MKIHQEESKFQPVTITLESEDEVQLMLAALGVVSISEDVENVNFTYDIYKSLKGIVGLRTYDVKHNGLGGEIIRRKY